MKYKFYKLLVIIILAFNSVNAQNPDKHINRLIGEIDQEWLNSICQTLPACQLDYSLRSAQGFEKTSTEARKQATLDQSWYLYKNVNGQEKAKPEKVQIPHQFERNRKYNSAWYFSKYKIDKQPEKHYFLKLSRIDLLSAVYVNGQKCGSHIGSYTPFELDITDQLISGDNSFAILVYDKSGAVNKDRLITQVGPARFKAGKQGYKYSGGIDDIPVLEVREETHIKDLFVKTSTRKGEIEIEYELSGAESIDKLSFEIFKWPNGEKVDLKLPVVENQTIPEGVNSVKAKWENADLWSPDHPNLYVLRASLQNNSTKDILEVRFGFREFWIDGKTFMLNGTPTRLRGESHYHLFTQGVDFHREVFKMHKETFGSNACRVHAFMPHPDIFLGADEAGILIINQNAVWSVNGQLYAKGGEDLLNNLKEAIPDKVNDSSLEFFIGEGYLMVTQDEISMNYCA